MKRLFFLSLFLMVLVFTFPVLAQVSYPEPRGFVNDFANIIPDKVEQGMEQNLRNYNQKTTNEIAVVTVVSLEGLTIEQYTMGLAEKWGVGKKGKDNGVILLVAPNERKVRIEVGYGLESVLTDARAKMIIEKAITPDFKTGDYGAGIEKGVAEIIKVITPPASSETPATAAKEVKFDSSVGLIFGVILLGLVVIIGSIILTVKLTRAYERHKAEVARRAVVRQNATKNIQTVKDALAKALTDVQGMNGGGK